jgi:hypothetical protein
MQSLTVIVAAVLATAGSTNALLPWASNTDPTDVAKCHVEEINSSRHPYVIVQGGTMDGENCRSPVGTWQGWQQTWESNRSVRLENVGTSDVVNPWLFNGRNNWRTIDEIVASAIEPGMTGREKAIALWWFETTHRCHFPCRSDEVKTPVKVLNIFGYNTCGDDAQCLAGLWHAAGLQVRPARLIGHCVSQAFYDAGWHLLDSDMQSIYLLRDNQTIASEQDVVRDHDLIKRTHTQGILQPDSRAADEWEAAIYAYEGNAGGERDCVGHHAMNMTLRPGESLTWRWGHLDPVKFHGKSTLTNPAGLCAPCVDHVCNGLWEYHPDFFSDIWRKGADAIDSAVATESGLAAEPGKDGTIVWTIRSPYVIVGGRLEVGGQAVRWSFSWDGKTWQAVSGNLDALFPPDGPARYQYQLRCELRGMARLKRLGIINDVQMAPFSLPAMVVGGNRFVYIDESPGAKQIRITHQWIERSASRPPEAPPAAVFPADRCQPEGTDIVFQWTAPADPDDDKIADYHFELSDRPDMKWPLSPNFSKLISLTADRDKAQYTLSAPGLLTPDKPHYWRVCAKDAKGVWGPWGHIWSFTPRGPAAPVDVALDFDPRRSQGILRWTANPVGSRPVKYRVYGSDEKGFTASDEAYTVNVGVSQELAKTFPGNFVAETTATELPVIGVGLEFPNANRAFYRIIAVDECGDRSGPSDYASAPRPVIVSRPVNGAKVGNAYHYQLAAIRSLGDLRARMVNGNERMSFWDIEKPRFSLKQGPVWLKLDAGSGLLTGTPDVAGKVEVVVEATVDREVPLLDEEQWTYGREVVTSVATQHVGSATQRFVIDVER